MGLASLFMGWMMVIVKEWRAELEKSNHNFS
jgi:hypothetical protein